MPTQLAAPAWSIPGFLDIKENHLTIDGVDAIQLAADYDHHFLSFPNREYDTILID